MASLKKHLLQAPDLTNNLTGVLCRFHREPLVLMCDIEAMFHQVKVPEEYRDLLRFPWWDDGDTSKKPQEYRITVHLLLLHYTCIITRLLQLCPHNHS